MGYEWEVVLMVGDLEDCDFEVVVLVVELYVYDNVWCWENNYCMEVVGLWVLLEEYGIEILDYL